MNTNNRTDKNKLYMGKDRNANPHKHESSEVFFFLKKKEAIFLILLQEKKKHCSLPVFRKVIAVALYLGLIIASVS